MSNGHVDGIDPVTGAQCRAYQFALVLQGNPGAPFAIQRPVLTPQNGLGATDGRQVCQEAQVACQPEPSGVGQPLAVCQEKIRRGCQEVQRRQHEGSFPEDSTPST